MSDALGSFTGGGGRDGGGDGSSGSGGGSGNGLFLSSGSGGGSNSSSNGVPSASAVAAAAAASNGAGPAVTAAAVAAAAKQGGRRHGEGVSTANDCSRCLCLQLLLLLLLPKTVPAPQLSAKTFSPDSIPPPHTHNALPIAQTAAKLEAFLKQRAKTDLALLPIVRGALRDTTLTLRRARFGMGAVSFVVGAARAGAAVQYALVARAYEAARDEEARQAQLEKLQDLARRRRW